MHPWLGRICVGTLGGLAFFSGGPGSASADFTVCNQTASAVELALAYQQGDVWISEGWWSAGAGGCATLVEGNLHNQFFYVRGESESKNWEEDFSFCYRDAAFTIQGDEDCSARGYKSGGFMEVDVGNSEDFTLELTE